MDLDKPKKGAVKSVKIKDKSHLCYKTNMHSINIFECTMIIRGICNVFEPNIIPV